MSDKWDWSDTWWLIKRRVKDFYYGIQYRINPRHKYHLVNFRKQEGWGGFHYSDVVERMLYANFQLLCEFVEHEEKSIKRINWEDDPGHANAIREIRSLYFWWKFQRQQDIKDEETLWDRIDEDVTDKTKPYWDDINERFDRFRNHPLHPEYVMVRNYNATIDNKQLERLIKIRNYLWT